MKFEKRANGEWAILPTGQNSKTRMDGGTGCIVCGQDGQVLEVYELNGKIETKAFKGEVTFKPNEN